MTPIQSTANAQCKAMIYGLITSLCLIIIVFVVFPLVQSTEYATRMCSETHPNILLTPIGAQPAYRLKILQGCLLFSVFPQYAVAAIVSNEMEAKKKLELYYRKDLIIK